MINAFLHVFSLSPVKTHAERSLPNSDSSPWAGMRDVFFNFPGKYRVAEGETNEDICAPRMTFVKCQLHESNLLPVCTNQ